MGLSTAACFSACDPGRGRKALREAEDVRAMPVTGAGRGRGWREGPRHERGRHKELRFRHVLASVQKAEPLATCSSRIFSS